MESERRVGARGDHARGVQPRGRARAPSGGWLDWLTDCGVPAISGVDTRALVRHIRERGRDARRGVPGGDRQSRRRAS